MVIDRSAPSDRPAMPHLMMNEYYMLQIDGTCLGRNTLIRTSAMADGRIAHKPIAIDINCRKFAILGIDVLGYTRSLRLILTFRRKKFVRIAYRYGPPEQLTFEQARDEICALVVRRGWYTQGWQNERQFVEKFMAFKSMKEVIGFVSFYGKWVF